MSTDDKKRERLGLAPQIIMPESGGVHTVEKELAEVCARFADICQYFSQQNMDLPSQIVDEVRLLSKLAVKERIARTRRLNQDLMEYLNDARPDSQIRH